VLQLSAGTLARVAIFLSTEWLQQLDEAARASDSLHALGAVDPFVIEQRVQGGPDGDVAYHFVFGAEGTRVAPGPADQPDLTVTADYETAVALHAGELNAQQALGSGGLRLSGAPNDVLRRADALRNLDDVFAAVRASTTLS